MVSIFIADDIYTVSINRIFEKYLLILFYKPGGATGVVYLDEWSSLILEV